MVVNIMKIFLADMTKTQKLTQDKKKSLFNAVKGRKFAKGGEVEKSGQKMFD